jgi:Transglycosylase SLT domain
MAQATTTRTIARRAGARRARAATRRPALVRAAGRVLLALLAAPLAVRLVVGTLAVVAVWWAVNWVYQVARKPSELFFPVSGSLAKAPPATWRQYGPLFREHSTAVITPDLLAALAQVEASGNPVARTYWRWQMSWNPLQIYQPASSAVGMFQLTDGTFQHARRYCIHDHVVVETGRWTDPRACWFNGLYTRVVPSHAVELTAALLDRSVAQTLGRPGVGRATLRQQQDLAAIIHLCGAGAGAAYARRGFRLTASQRCGDHDAARYLARVNALRRQFVRLAATG